MPAPSAASSAVVTRCERRAAGGASRQSDSFVSVGRRVGRKNAELSCYRREGNGAKETAALAWACAFCVACVRANACEYGARDERRIVRLVSYVGRRFGMQAPVVASSAVATRVVARACALACCERRANSSVVGWSGVSSV